MFGTLQLPLHQATSLKLASDMGLRAVGPAVDFGVQAFFGQALAQRSGHGDHMHQRYLGLELCVEHHGAANIANRALGGLFHDGHQAREVQEYPHDDASHDGGNARPASRVIGRDHQHDQT